jgi:hypothetical protein
VAVRPAQKREEIMATQDRGCTIVPYFTVHAGKLGAFKAVAERCVAQTS